MVSEYQGVMFGPSQYHGLPRLFEENGIVYFGDYDNNDRFIHVVAVSTATQQEVGELDTSITPDGRKWLDNITCGNQQIGENLIEAAIIVEPNLLVEYDPHRDEFNSLISRCIDNGILKHERNFEREDSDIEMDDSCISTPTSTPI